MRPVILLVLAAVGAGVLIIVVSVVAIGLRQAGVIAQLPPTAIPTVRPTTAPTPIPTTVPKPTAVPPTVAAAPSKPTEPPPPPTEVPPAPTQVPMVVPTTPPPAAPTAPPAPPTAAPQPTAAPKPEAPARPTVAAVTAAPAPYEWVSMERTSTPNRLRFSAAIVMPAEYSDDQIVRAFRDAMNRAFREQPTAKAVVVFGHSSRAEINKGADLGSARASSDRQGWTGDGKFDADRDEGKLYVNVGSSWTIRPQSHLVIDR